MIHQAAQDEPQVSIIIPVYNRSNYLIEAVQSALNQTYLEVEVVVADDGSEDVLLKKALNSLERTPRLRVLRLSHAGVAATRNRAIQTSTAKYILPLDDDDLLEPSYVSKCVKVLEERPDIGMVYSKADFIGSKSGEWALPSFTMKRMLIDNCIFASALYRKSDWQRSGGYNSRLPAREDHDFFLRLLNLGLSPHRLDEVLFHYRQHGESRNQLVALDRRKLIEAHSTMFRYNSDLYLREAEHLWAAIFDMKDEINNLRNRYALIEHWRANAGPLLKAVKRVFK